MTFMFSLIFLFRYLIFFFLVIHSCTTNTNKIVRLEENKEKYIGNKTIKVTRGGHLYPKHRVLSSRIKIIIFLLACFCFVWCCFLVSLFIFAGIFVLLFLNIYYNFVRRCVEFKFSLRFKNTKSRCSYNIKSVHFDSEDSEEFIKCQELILLKY